MRGNPLIAFLGKMTLGAIVLGVCVPSGMAQRGFGAQHSGFNRGYSANSAFRRGGSFFYPLPADGYYSDALNAGYPVASQPPIVILQAPPAAEAVADTPSGEPVLIELQGDTYVRVSGPPASGAMLDDAQGSRSASGPAQTLTHSPQTSAPLRKSLPRQSADQQSSAEPKSVVLVFRDGHKENVSDYVITNGTLYAHTNYYTSGAWTKNVSLAALDVPETVNFNQSHGVTFQLPNAANEVIVGP